MLEGEEQQDRWAGLLFSAVWGQGPESWGKFSLPGILLRSHVLHSTLWRGSSSSFPWEALAHEAFEWAAEQVQRFSSPEYLHS